jgi:hypothetical protein
MLSIPYAIDPDEVWEIDFVRSVAKRQIKVLDSVIAGFDEDVREAKDEEGRKRFEAERARLAEKRAALAADLAAYTGGGPVFTVGHLPGAKRAGLAGEGQAIGVLAAGSEKATRDREWAREVVRWSVKGHAGLLAGREKKPVPFAAESVTWSGSPREVVSERTLDAYEPIVLDLALAIWDSQRLDGAEKNG